MEGRLTRLGSVADQLRRMPGEARALAEVATAASGAFGVSRPWAARRARRLRARSGYTYREALAEGLLDPAIPEAELARYVSRFALTGLQWRLNPEETSPLTGDKTIFARYAEAAGIPSPPVLATLGGRAVGWSRDGGVLRGAVDWARLVAQALPDEFVVKPSAGHHGHGVRVLRRDGDRLIDLARGPTTAEALYAALIAHPEFDLFMVQERLNNHPKLAPLSADGTLQTVRVNTYIDRAGAVRPYFAVLKVASGGGAIDNFRGGETGNGICEVSLADGRVGPLLLGRADRSGLERSEVLPGTDLRLEGMMLPDWAAALDMLTAAAPALLPARTFGWDVALTPSGPVVVEANAGYEGWPSLAFADAVAAIDRDLRAENL